MQQYGNTKGSESIIARVSKMSDLVDYQEGSIVSRMLVDKNGGTITLFAFGEGQGLSEHTAPFDAVVYVFDGQTDITISGKTLRLKSGDMTIMPADAPHSLKAVGSFKMMLVMVKA